MNRIFRFYNQNKQRFWIILVIIVLIIIVLRGLNNYYKNAKEESSGIDDTTTSRVIEEPKISGNKIEKETSKEIVKIIDDFIRYCNNKEYENAYKLLSEDCKEELYPTAESFKQKYVDKIFKSKRNYSIVNWITDDNLATYKVDITEDILSTGGGLDFNTSEYYTVVKQGEKYALNINSFITKQNLSKNAKNNEINASVTEKIVYMDYVIYKLSVKNNTLSKIMMDSKEKLRTVYLVDEEENIYQGMLNENTPIDLTIPSGITKEIKIKFNKQYSIDIKDSNIEFTDVILNTNNMRRKNHIYHAIIAVVVKFSE